MYEVEAIKAIKEGVVIIEDIKYQVQKHPKGYCEGCSFDIVENNVHLKCPSKALNICCSGGYILKRI